MGTPFLSCGYGPGPKQQAKDLQLCEWCHTDWERRVDEQESPNPRCGPLAKEAAPGAPCRRNTAALLTVEEATEILQEEAARRGLPPPDLSQLAALSPFITETPPVGMPPLPESGSPPPPAATNPLSVPGEAAEEMKDLSDEARPRAKKKPKAHAKSLPAARRVFVLAKGEQLPPKPSSTSGRIVKFRLKPKGPRGPKRKPSLVPATEVDTTGGSTKTPLTEEEAQQAQKFLEDMSTEKRMKHNADWAVETLCLKCGVSWFEHTSLVCKETKDYQLENFAMGDLYASSAPAATAAEGAEATPSSTPSTTT